MDVQLTITLLVTIVLTTLLVRGWTWLRQAKVKNPELYRQRYTIRTFVILLLHLGDL